MIPEIGWTGTSGIAPISTQALEMDADAHAACQGVAFIRGLIDNPQNTPVFWQESEKPFQAALWDWSFAIFSLFRLFAGARPTMLQREETPYPPPRLRQTMISATIHALLERDLTQKRPMHT